MKKFKVLFLLIFCIFLQVSVNAETLQCSIEKVWNVDSAREEAFKDLKPVLDLSWAPPIDPNLIENKKYINHNQNEPENRSITTFNDGSYGVTILDDDNYDKVYYYYPSGELYAIDFTVFPNGINSLETYYKKQELQQIYPIKNYKHAYPSGKLVNISLTVNGQEIYGFKLSGELIYHWIGANCYDVNGEKIQTKNDPNI